MKPESVVIVVWVLLAGMGTSLEGVSSTQTSAEAVTTSERAPQLVTNTVGFLPSWPKVAFLLNAGASPRPVFLVDVSTGAEVMEVPAGDPVLDTASGDRIIPLDFSPVDKVGRYILRQGELISPEFSIGTDDINALSVTLLRSYYLQRCGHALYDPVTGLSHLPCHLKDGTVAHTNDHHQKGDLIAATGGWHDAGDYGKYVSTTAVVIGRLVSLYENYPALFPDQHLSIPESGNGISDLLDEVRFGAAWLMRMQRGDGGVYRKLSGKVWPRQLSPAEDLQPRLVYGVSTPETAKTAAALAMVSRVFASVDADFSQVCLERALRAWDFLEAHPIMVSGWQEGDDSGSGKYLSSDIDTEESLTVDTDDRFWAAAELALTTGQSTFIKSVKSVLPRLSYDLFEWKNPSPLGLMTLHVAGAAGRSFTVESRKIRSVILKRADRLLERVDQSGYRLANQRFIWGSNKMASEEGITLAEAYRMTGNIRYFRAAIDQLYYLLGRNHFSLRFISGNDSRAVRNVCHLWAQARKVMIPGLFVGGPNDLAQCGKAPRGLGPLSYEDHGGSYSTNEYAIDYNSALIGLIVTLLSVSDPSAR